MARSSRKPSAPSQSSSSSEDAFLARVVALSYWARDRVHVLVVLGIAVVLVGVGAFYYYDQRQADRQEAADTLEGIHGLVEMGQEEEAHSELEAFLDQYSGLPEALEARLLLGRVQLEEGNPEAAQVTLEPLAESMDDPVGLDGAFLLGHAYEELERWEEAEALYLRIHDETPLTFQQRDALEAAARARTEQGHHGQAAALYEDILDLLEPGDPARPRFEMKLAEAQARAEG